MPGLRPLPVSAPTGMERRDSVFYILETASTEVGGDNLIAEQTLNTFWPSIPLPQCYTTTTSHEERAG